MRKGIAVLIFMLIFGNGCASFPVLFNLSAEHRSGRSSPLPPHLSGLFEQLHHTKPAISKQAVLKLSKSRDPLAIVTLIDLLHGDDPALRAKAGEILVNIGAPATELLVESLSGKICLSEVEASILEKIGPPVISPLIKTLRASDCLSRRHIAEVLVRLGETAYEPLLPALLDKNACVRKTVVFALGEIGHPQALKPLLKAARDESPWVREAVVKALGKIGGRKIFPPLIDALWDKNEWVRKAAALALQENALPAAAFGYLKVISPLVYLLKVERQQEVREAAAGALAAIGPPAVPALVKLLQSKDEGLRRTAAEVLGKLAWRAKTDLEKAWWLAAREETEKAAALGEAAIEPLLAILKSEDLNKRKRAAAALTGMGVMVVEPVIALLWDDDIWVREEAAVILKNLRDERAIEPLNDLVMSGDFSCEERKRVYRTVADEFPEGRIRKPGDDCPDKHYCELCGKPATHYCKLTFRSLCESHRTFDIGGGLGRH